MQLRLTFTLANQTHEFDEDLVDVVTRTSRCFHVGYAHAGSGSVGMSVHARVPDVQFISDEEHRDVIGVLDAKNVTVQFIAFVQ